MGLSVYGAGFKFDTERDGIEPRARKAAEDAVRPVSSQDGEFRVKGSSFEV